METPSSTRRITRSLAAAAASAQKSAAAAADASAHLSRAKKDAQAQSRAALLDITNDSPIVGLAAGGLHAEKTPASTAAKTRARPRRTPGSGEALLRGQVKTLLQKVDEEACVGAAAAAILRPTRIQEILSVSRSPAQLLAPTPANTPQIGNVSADGLVMMPCVLEEEDLIPKLQVVAAPLPPQTEESLGESQLNRALVFDDSPGKSDMSNDGSIVSSFPGSISDISPDDDRSSVWSIQVNVNSEREDEELVVDTVGELEEKYYTEDDEEEYYTEVEEEEWDEDDDDGCFDDLCEGMSKMSVFDGEEARKVGLPEFEGKHTRFVYNSDDEIVEGKEVANAAAEHGALLRGLPVPEGKHLRFHDEEDD